MLRYAIMLSTLLLAGCGGGGNSQPSPPSPVPQPRSGELLFCYFGMLNKQLEETADHINAIHTPDWGNWDDPTDRERIAQQTVAYLLAARMRGIDKAIVSCGFLLFDSNHKYRGIAELMAFKTRLDVLSLSSMVVALYPIDEPDVLGISDVTMLQVYGEVRQSWPVKIAVIYGSHGTPGANAADWIGHDEYGRDAGVLNRMPRIRNGQQWIIVPGGANPWRNTPEPFREFADTHGQVACIMPFVWFDREKDEQGQRQAGIRSNGLADRYRSIGVKKT